MEYQNGISEKYGNKAASVRKHLQSALGTGWEDDLYGLKLKILSSDSTNLLDSLLYGACQMMELLRKLEVKKPRNHPDEQVVTENSIRRENNLMVFGDWNKKDNYDKEINKVLNHLGVKETAYDTEIICGNGQKRADEKVVIKVKFEGSKPVVDALSSAKKLTNFEMRKVAIDKDRSFEERTKLRASVKQLRQKIREEPWLHWVIRDYKVINLGVRRTGKYRDKANAKMVMSMGADEICCKDDSPSESDAEMEISMRVDEMHCTDDSANESDAEIESQSEIYADEMYYRNYPPSDSGSCFSSIDSKDPEICKLLRGNSHYSGSDSSDY